MYNRFTNRGFEILAFPCNQFNKMEAWDAKRIKVFVRGLGAEFPLFAKIDVNGPKTHPLYRWLRANSKLAGGKIFWNFGKFLIDRSGHVVRYTEVDEEPLALIASIDELTS